MLEKLLIKSKDKDEFFVDWIKNNSKRKGYLTIEQEKLKYLFYYAGSNIYRLTRRILIWSLLPLFLLNTSLWKSFGHWLRSLACCREGT